MRRTGVDSASARPTPGAGYHMNKRDYGTGICRFEMSDGLPCGTTFVKSCRQQICCPRHSRSARSVVPVAELRKRKEIGG